MTTLHEAHRALLDMAANGEQYRKDQILFLDENDSSGAEIVGRGFDLERIVSVALDSTTTDANVRFRMLAMPDGVLYIRTWLDWTSSYGDHHSFVNYKLDAESIEILDAQPPQPEEEVDESSLNMDDAVGILFEHVDLQAKIGADWRQDYPQPVHAADDYEEPSLPDNMAMEYHSKFVLAARETEPKLLNMLSDTDLGGAEAQEIIDLYDWLVQQPEVNALV